VVRIIIIMNTNGDPETTNVKKSIFVPKCFVLVIIGCCTCMLNDLRGNTLGNCR
jgi:hypothetical protein